MREDAAPLFDPSALGLLSHYSPAVHNRIRRIMLEDWQQSGVKLPTYMKLLGRFIAPMHVPEEWLAKLSHQTMAKMLKSVSTPRYEFWACLHLYILKKYGAIPLEAQANEAALLGQAVSQFAALSPIKQSGVFALDEHTRLSLTALPENLYAFAETVYETASDQPFFVPVQEKAEGIAFLQDAQGEPELILILRILISRKISVRSYPPGIALKDQIS